MKKETIFRHELNESIQANAAMNCLKNRNKPQVATQEQEEAVDYSQLAEDVVASYRGRLSKMDEKERVNFISTMVMKKIGKTIDTLTPQEKKEIISAAKHSMWYVSEQEEFDIEASRAAYYSQDEPDYDDDSHGIRLILNMLMARGDITKNDFPRLQEQIKSMLDAEGMWIGDDESEAQRFIEMYWDNQEQEEDGINKGGMHNSVQVGHIMNTPSMNDSLDTEYFSDLEEQEAYYENFRAIAELVADQIDRENGKDIANNMDTLFAIVREVWNNHPDDLYIWDFDDVQEDDCYKFFDKYYETIKNEYLKREHNNIMAATHDDLFAH